MSPHPSSQLVPSSDSLLVKIGRQSLARNNLGSLQLLCCSLLFFNLQSSGLEKLSLEQRFHFFRAQFKRFCFVNHCTVTIKPFFFF